MAWLKKNAFVGNLNAKKKKKKKKKKKPFS